MLLFNDLGFVTRERQQGRLIFSWIPDTSENVAILNGIRIDGRLLQLRLSQHEEEVSVFLLNQYGVDLLQDQGNPMPIVLQIRATEFTDVFTSGLHTLKIVSSGTGTLSLHYAEGDFNGNRL
ncbi:hypothetical protein C4588_07185 [Candidatus Parcubacteria bacterium]|nr:MAG: hypothetical protein C4588_07185 [Candidatus Parcubacteria bacterium]